MTRKFLNYLLPLLFLFSALFASAQYDQFGIIYPDSLPIQEYCCTIFPNERGIAVYDAPNGTSIGTLQRKAVDQYGNEDQYSLIMVTTTGDSSKVEIWGDMKEIGNEKLALTFDAHKDGFVNVLPSIEGVWIELAELEKLGFRTLDYQSFLTSISGKVLGLYPESNLNLRKSPSASAEMIETMSYLHEISLTGKHQGQWSEVSVIKLKANRCSGEEDVESYALKGWIKVIDNEGNLNIWFMTRGC